MGGSAITCWLRSGSEEVMYPIHVAAANGEGGLFRKKSWESCRDLGFHRKFNRNQWEVNGKFMGFLGGFFGNGSPKLCKSDNDDEY